jgi:hypothetical protein
LSLFHAHHSGEEAIAFPAIEVRVPTAPVQQLCSDHEEIKVALDRIKQVLAQTETGVDDRVVLAGLSQEMALLNEIWHRHIHLEEDVFSAKRLQEAFKKAETDDMDRQLSEFGQKEGGPGYLLLPFLLYNLDTQDRLEMGQEFPPVVMQELIPIVWKDKWASMMPFLLP